VCRRQGFGWWRDFGDVEGNRVEQAPEAVVRKEREWNLAKECK
jgi:hypothetical protein